MAAPEFRRMAVVSLANVACFLSFSFGSASINLDELNSINYAVDILNKPVLIGQETSAMMMHLKSKYGQQYQCILPEVVPSMKPLVSSSGTNEPDFVGKGHQQEDSSTTSPSPNGIVDLLKPLESGPCLIKTKDWWTYEFCYGKYIKQFHLEDGKNSGPVMLLGLYESEFDWNNESQSENSDRNRLHRYHSQYYVNGTRCDVTGKPRRTEVQFLCEEGAGDYIAHVDEPESCRYLVRIHTMRVCHHPYLRPPPTNKPKSIVCSPVLNADQYQDYLQQQEDERRAAKEEVREWLKLQEEKLAKRKSTDDQTLDTVGGSQAEASNDKSAADNENTKIKDGEVSSSFQAEEDVSRVATRLDPIQISSLDISTLYQDAGEKENSKTNAEDDVSEGNLEGNDESDEEKVMYGKIVNTINKLMEQLDKTEKDIGLANDQFEKLKTQWTNKVIDVLHGNVDDAQLQEDEPENWGLYGKSDEIVMEKPEMEMENPLDNIERVDGNSEVYVLKGEDDDDANSNGKVRVKVGLLDPSEVKSAEYKSKDSKEKQEFEKALLEKLQQSGLDTSGQKVEVKIITSGYFDENGNKFTILSDEDSKQFQALVLKLLDGNQEVVVNMAQQKKLEDGYKFNWNTQPKSAFDDEEDQ